MYLSEAGISEQGAFFMSPPDSGCIASFRIRGKEEYISIATGTKKHSMRAVCFDLSGNKITRNNSSGFSIDDDNIKYLSTIVHLHFSIGNLTVQRRISAQQQLLTGLTTRIKCS